MMTNPKQKLALRWLVVFLTAYLAMGAPRVVVHQHLESQFASQQELQQHLKLLHTDPSDLADDTHTHWIVGASMIDRTNSEVRAQECVSSHDVVSIGWTNSLHDGMLLSVESMIHEKANPAPRPWEPSVSRDRIRQGMSLSIRC